eukprot:UN06112
MKKFSNISLRINSLRLSPLRNELVKDCFSKELWIVYQHT